MDNTRRWPNVLFWVFASIVTLLPIYWMFVVSAKSRVELFGAPNFIIRSFFWENYTATLSNPAFQAT
jgi:multiple sugar transport system permease protein